MPTSLVTGGTGFLGSHLCEYLLSQGHRVICVDNSVVSSLTNIEHIRSDDFVFVNHDMTEHLEVDERVDFLFHLAALASLADYMRMPLHSLKVGSYGTHNASARQFKRARFLIASTSEVYGDPLVHPQPESYWGTSTRSAARRRRRGEALRAERHRRWRTTASKASTPRSSGSSTRWAADAAARRARDSDFSLRQALASQTDHGLRRRLPDAELLLRRRPHPRALPARDER